MKKFIPVLVILAFMALAFSPLPSFVLEDAPPVPTLPDWSLLLFTSLATWIVTNGLKSLSKALPWLPEEGLTGWGTSLVAVIVNGIVLVANGFFASLPPSSYSAVTAVLVFLGTLFSAYGIHEVVKRFQPPVIKKLK